MREIEVMIAKVIRWDNGIVTVFDQRGAQLPEFQGLYEDVRDRILEEAPEEAEFFEGKWRHGYALIRREEW